MATFGEFFITLRRLIEKTGRTDAACGDMDRYERKHCTEPEIPWGREDRGWQVIADQELSHLNLLAFSAEMTQAGLNRLTERLNDDCFDPDGFSWTLDSVHEFHHAILKVARECGLDVDSISGWSKAKDEMKRLRSTPS